MTTLLKKRRPPTAPPRRINAAIPLLLLLLALSTVYLFGADWGHFRRHLPSHDGDSAKNLALAENLSPNHNFRLFLRLYPGPDGAPAYEMYSRFPIGSYALIKLAIAPFGDHLSAQLHAARILMLLMFAAAAALAYQSLRRITARPAIALTATLMAFSSYYILFYNDMIANEIIMDLFAVMLVFHGMTVFIQEKRFPQLLIKTAIAILLGWHVYALLLPFIALGLTRELIRAAKHPHPLTAPPLARLRYIAKKFLTSRYLTLALAAALFGLAVLTFNLANEYTAHDGNVPLQQLPSAQSILKRIGQDPQYNAAQIDALEWRRFLPGQFRRIGRMTLPYALTAHTDGLHGFHPPGQIPLPYLPIGLAALAACLAGLLLTPRHRLLLATLALSGIAWAILVRHNTAVHNYESVFYIGIPLTLFTLILWQAQQQWSRRRIPQCARPLTTAQQWSRRRIPQCARPLTTAQQWSRRRLPRLGRPLTTAQQWSHRPIPQCARPLTTAAAIIALLTFTLSAYQMSRTDAQAQDPRNPSRPNVRFPNHPPTNPQPHRIHPRRRTSPRTILARRPRHPPPNRPPNLPHHPKPTKLLLRRQRNPNRKQTPIRLRPPMRPNPRFRRKPRAPRNPRPPNPQQPPNIPVRHQRHSPHATSPIPPNPIPTPHRPRRIRPIPKQPPDRLPQTTLRRIRHQRKVFPPPIPRRPRQPPRQPPTTRLRQHRLQLPPARRNPRRKMPSHRPPTQLRPNPHPHRPMDPQQRRNLANRNPPQQNPPLTQPPQTPIAPSSKIPLPHHQKSPYPHHQKSPAPSSKIP